MITPCKQELNESFRSSPQDVLQNMRMLTFIEQTPFVAL